MFNVRMGWVFMNFLLAFMYLLYFRFIVNA